MSSYEESGVNIALGDSASRTAFLYAAKTFGVRQGLIGEPLAEEGGFTGLLNFGNFYLAMNADGVGTKIELARKLQYFDGLGYDLLAMVADDGICMGAETVAITNTFDTDKVRPDEIEKMMKSLSKACIEQEVVIAGGEIAEMNTLCNGTMWNATSIGVVKKDKIINGDKIEIGDAVISLYEEGLRSNGFSLVRKIIKEKNLGQEMEKLVLTPSTIYMRAVLSALHGAFDQDKKVDLHGLCHVTGGGIAGNLRRILKKKGLGARLDDIFKPSDWVKELQTEGEVADKEAYSVWNMGNGMLIVINPKDADKAISELKKVGIKAKIVGKISKNPQIIVRNHGAQKRERNLIFDE